MEQNNRDPIRPTPISNGLIVHTINGTIKLVLPRYEITGNNGTDTENNETRICSDPGECVIKTLEIQMEIRDLLIKYLNNINNIPSIALKEEVVISPGDKIQITLEYGINIAKTNQANINNSFYYVNQLKTNLDKLNTVFNEFNNTYENLNKLISFSITSNVSAYVIDQTSNSYLKNDYNNVIGGLLDEYYLVKILGELENVLRDNVRPGQPAVPDTYNVLQQNKRLNSTNQSRWLDTQVKRLLHGSEVPVPINLPSKDKPFYSFQNGAPIAGFMINAFSTGYNMALDHPPALIPTSVSHNGITPIPYSNVSNPGTTPSPYIYGSQQPSNNTSPSVNIRQPVYNISQTREAREARQLSQLLNNVF